MFIHTSPPLGNNVGNQSFNCVGGGGTLAYNLTKMFGVAADLGGCKFVGLSNQFGIGSQISANNFTFLFGPRITFRGSSPFQPFFEVNFGADRLSLSCNSNTNCQNFFGTASYSWTAFALTAGGGFDIKLNKKFSLRPVQAEYLYTRFGNNCGLHICGQNNSQNSFRLKSGIVIGWGGSAK
jgi:opacity protein-like surface antigen